MILNPKVIKMKVLKQEFTVPFRYNVCFTNGLFEPDNRTLVDTISLNARNLPAKVYFVLDDQVAQKHPQLLEQVQVYCQQHNQKLQLSGDAADCSRRRSL